MLLETRPEIDRLCDVLRFLIGSSLADGAAPSSGSRDNKPGSVKLVFF